MTEPLVCGDCGMPLTSPEEFHPYLYCLLVGAGFRDPAAYLATLGFTRDAVSKS